MPQPFGSPPLIMLARLARILHASQLASLALVLAAGAIVALHFSRFEAAEAWTQHTYEVVDDINATRSSVLRAGLWLRNYAISPDAASLARVRLSAKEAKRTAQRLTELTTDNPTQLALAIELASEVAETAGWLMGSAVIAERDGHAALQTLLAARINQDGNRRLRTILDEMEANERGLLLSRQADERKAFASVKGWVLLAASTFAVFSLWTLWHASRLTRIGEANYQELRTDAQRDPLTGLLNRRGMLQRAKALGQRNILVVAFDLDDFKPINDSFGHAAGDRVLQTVASRLTDQCRDVDVVARVGGDEFVIILPDIDTAAAVERITARLTEAITAPIVLETNVVYVGASIGTAVSGVDAKELDALLAVADARSYSAKRSDRRQAVDRKRSAADVDAAVITEEITV